MGGVWEGYGRLGQSVCGVVMPLACCSLVLVRWVQAAVAVAAQCCGPQQVHSRIPTGAVVPQQLSGCAGPVPKR